MKKLIKLKTVLMFVICICTVFFCTGCTNFVDLFFEKLEYELDNFGVDSENIGIDDYLDLKDDSFFGGGFDGYQYKVNDNVFFSINAFGNGGYVCIKKTNFEQGTDIITVKECSEEIITFKYPDKSYFCVDLDNNKFYIKNDKWVKVIDLNTGEIEDYPGEVSGEWESFYYIYFDE